MADEFSDDEIRLIFERAGRLDASTAGDRRRSLAELQAIGAEAGLDPRDIAMAAATVRPTQRHWFTGGPGRFRTSRLIPRLDEQGITDVVGILRQATGLQGELRWHPTETEWRVRTGVGVVCVTFTRRGDETRADVLIVRDDARGFTVIGSGLIGTALGVGTGVLIHHVLGASVVAGVGGGVATFAAATIGLARAWWTSRAKRWKERTDDLARTIERVAPHASSNDSDITK